METWRTILTTELASNGETWADVESNTMTDEQMDTAFDSGYGTSDGCPFTVWTKGRVYFPVVYDGAEWASSVSRHPDGKPTRHKGGE
jgi:hypothetical protein